MGSAKHSILNQIIEAVIVRMGMQETLGLTDGLNKFIYATDTISLCSILSQDLTQLAGAVEYTDCISVVE